ncbi:MAG: response regulator [Natronomonas sp.]
MTTSDDPMANEPAGPDAGALNRIIDDVPVIFDERDLSAVSVLLVDDDPSLLDLTATFLKRERENFEVTTKTDAEAALSYLRSNHVDAIVSDYQMPGTDGLEFLEEVREEQGLDIPFILFTAEGGETIASEAISKGVTDYLQKETGSAQYSILANRLINAVEQHHASKALRQSQQKFSKLVRNSIDVIAIVNESGCFEYISPACEHVLGYEQEELIGTVAFDYMPPEDRQAAMETFFTAIENPEMEPTIQFRFEHPEEEWTVVEARGKNMFDDESINGFVVYGRDISQLEQKQQELKQQNEQLEDTRQAISHDLRNPISVATGAVELYRDTGEESYLRKVESALERMDVLLDNVETLADNVSEVEKTEQVALDSIVESAWQLIETDGAELHVEDTKEFEANPRQLQRVFENLIENAIEHADGPVTVRVGTTDSAIYVEDDGPGIPEDRREMIFDTGYTTVDENTGFGLNVARQIVLGHGWTISATDGDDGTRFEISGVTFRPAVYN